MKQMIFLNENEIVELTGYKHKAKQCAYLEFNHIPYRLNARGEPKVTTAYINGTKTQKITPSWQPNLKMA